MLCCDPIGSNMEKVEECPDCGSPVDEDGDSLEICYYSPEECDTCGWAPCDGSC